MNIVKTNYMLDVFICVFSCVLFFIPLLGSAATATTLPLVTGISADGKTVVGGEFFDSGNDNIGLEAFLTTSLGTTTRLGTLSNGDYSIAFAVNGDGTVIVGAADSGNTIKAFRWTESGGIESLGTLTGGEHSIAFDVNSNGGVVVGVAENGSSIRAFRWTEPNGMQDLGTLAGGDHSIAYGVNAEGDVVVGAADDGSDHVRAFRWTPSAGMIDLGTLSGGSHSIAFDVNASGNVIVGAGDDGNDHIRAFRWTSTGGMKDLGVLAGGNHSVAFGVNADGNVVVGTADDGINGVAFRWSETTGMQSVESWLSANGVAVGDIFTAVALDVSADGNIVVGTMRSGESFIARVSADSNGDNGGSGLITLNGLNSFQNSLANQSQATMSNATTATNLLMNGAHGKPLFHKVQAGEKAFWISGDMGRDNDRNDNTQVSLAELGVGYNFGSVQINGGIGKISSSQDTELNGKIKAKSNHMFIETILSLSKKYSGLFVTLGAYIQDGKVDSRRGYLNAGIQDFSSANVDINGVGVRARVDWNNALNMGKSKLSPYMDLSHSKIDIGSYTEVGGGFPAYFNSQKSNITELRLGLNSAIPLKKHNIKLVGNMEVAHRFEKQNSNTTGNIVGLFDFELNGEKYDTDWLKAGIGLEGKLGKGKVSVMLNATTKGEAIGSWVAASYQLDF